MNINEYELLKENEDSQESLITAQFLGDANDRTLLYGFDCDRNTWHTYIKDGEIKTVMYGFKENPVEVNITKNEDYIPNKRLYPSMCDYEFCLLLSDVGVNLPFTTYREVKDEIYYGEIL